MPLLRAVYWQLHISRVVVVADAFFSSDSSFIYVIYWTVQSFYLKTQIDLMEH